MIPENGWGPQGTLATRGRWERGGTRVINFYRDAQMPLFLLLVYAKAQREDMTPDQKKQVRALAAALRQEYRRKR